MNVLHLKAVNVPDGHTPALYVAGQRVNLKRNEFGSYSADVQTNAQEAEIVFTRELELRAKLWWLYAILSFLVSILGIFEPPYDRKCIVPVCAFRVRTEGETSVQIALNTPAQTGEAAAVTGADAVMVRNEYFVDKTARRRFAVWLAVKLISWVAAAIIVCVVLI